MLDLVISNFTSPVYASIFPLWGTPNTHWSLQAFPSPFSESQRLQGESGGTSMQIGRASGTFPVQRTGKPSFHPAEINPASGVTNNILLGMHKFIPVNVLYIRPSNQQWWTPECSESVNATHRAWKQWCTLNNDSCRARYTCSCTTTKNCQLQAKSSYQSRLRGRLTSENLQVKQWRSTGKRAGGDKKGSDIPTQ